MVISIAVAAAQVAALVSWPLELAVLHSKVMSLTGCRMV